MSTIIPKYAIWNNKGGVGKTFLSFVIATEYARQNPQKQVILIDMCPQANLSEIALGGNSKGAAVLNQILKAKNIHRRKTIGGYFDARLLQPHSITGAETHFLTELSKYNDQLPSNIWLIVGDPSLELQAQAISQIAVQSLPSDTWRNVHSWLIDLTEAIKVQHPESAFFIDCNPSFSTYTELAILAANRLIVPCSADGSSARAIDNLAQLLFGIELPQDYQSSNFSHMAEKYQLTVPSIHLVPLNRSTQYGSKSSRAFAAMYGQVKERARALLEKAPHRCSLPLQQQERLFCDMPDAHTIAVVISHHGLPLCKIKAGRYDVHGKATQVNGEPLERYQKALKGLVELL